MRSHERVRAGMNEKKEEEECVRGQLVPASSTRDRDRTGGTRDGWVRNGLVRGSQKFRSLPTNQTHRPGENNLRNIREGEGRERVRETKQKT